MEIGIEAGNKAPMMSLAHVLALAEKPRSDRQKKKQIPRTLKQPCPSTTLRPL